MPTLELKIPPPLVALMLAAAMWGVSMLGPPLAIASDIRHGLVGVLVVVALAFDLTGILAFRAAHTTIHPMRPERTAALVTGGVYRITRNPMYLGLACLLLAWAVWLSALWPFAGIVCFVLYITRFQIRPEERVLLATFGEAYADYMARVRRWL